MPRRRRLLLAAAIAALVCLALSHSPGRFVPSRLATQREDVLYNFAEQTGEPALCDQISWRVYRHYSLMFAGGGGSYMRSDCYERTAEARQQPSLCWKVRPLVDFEWPSPGYSALACRRRTLRHEHSGTALAPEVLVRTFERMGYDIDHMPSDAVFPPAVRPRDVYWSLAKKPEAVSRAEQLLRDPGTGATAAAYQSTDRPFLANFTAIATSDSKWCDYIQPDLYLRSDYPAFRDTCLYELAINTSDPRICARMTPPAQDPKAIQAKQHGVRPDIAEQLTLRADCDRLTRAKAGVPRPLHYSAELPPDLEQTMRLILLLNGSMPSAQGWSLPDKARYFQNFLFGLWPHEHDAIHDAVRAELVRRLLALPDDSASATRGKSTR
jgi:hypothetical protein